MTDSANNYVNPDIYDEPYYMNWVVGAEEFKKGVLHPFFIKSLELADIKSEDSVLDVGFGRGEIIKYLVGKCKNIVGIDYSPAAYKIASDLVKDCNPKPELICEDVNEALPKLGMFDKVLLLDIVEHLYDWQLKLMFGELLKHLNKGAVIVIHTPIANNEAEKHYIDKINAEVIRYQTIQHINLNSFEEHTKYLKGFGTLERVGRMHIKFVYGSNKL
jgi:cyclopropane fatty-acyl-phospholipid synthase-like methyltransferase